MPHTLGQILPSLEALGIWSYWIIGLAAMLEAFFATGVFIPGTLVVDAGGILVQHGALDFFDLAWFVAIGSILGGEIGYWAGIWARRGMNTRWKPENSPSYQRAERLFRRHGGLALVLGRFSGPVAGLVPFAAAVSGMERRRFVIWNIVSGAGRQMRTSLHKDGMAVAYAAQRLRHSVRAAARLCLKFCRE